MNRQFFTELELPEPATDLSVGSGSPNMQVSAIISGLDEHFEKSRPDIAVVPGDTNSALAAGVACSKSRVPVAHLESGCRSGDYRMAEEVNRRLLDHLSQLLLCPTSSCVLNVRSEHVLAAGIYNVGDTMYDSLLKLLPRIRASEVASGYGLRRGEYAFMTLHRAETVDNPRALREVMDAVGMLPLPIAFSVHPRTRARIREFGLRSKPNIRLLEPLPYAQTLGLVKDSEFVITDSGGLQKEAFWLERPTLITRETTEWGEIVKAGAAFLVGTSPKRIREGYALIQRIDRRRFRLSKKVFGNGKASPKVVRAVSDFMRSGGRDWK